MKTNSKNTQQVIDFAKGTSDNLPQKAFRTIQFRSKEDMKREEITQNILKYTKSF
jgi:hypothetical protein